jgi:hypothetical protein
MKIPWLLYLLNIIWIITFNIFGNDFYEVFPFIWWCISCMGVFVIATVYEMIEGWIKR